MIDSRLDTENFDRAFLRHQEKAMRDMPELVLTDVLAELAQDKIEKLDLCACGEPIDALGVCYNCAFDGGIMWSEYKTGDLWTSFDLCSRLPIDYVGVCEKDKTAKESNDAIQTTHKRN